MIHPLQRAYSKTFEVIITVAGFNDSSPKQVACLSQESLSGCMRPTIGEEDPFYLPLSALQFPTDQALSLRLAHCLYDYLPNVFP
jgi:hypothetical protein